MPKRPGESQGSTSNEPPEWLHDAQTYFNAHRYAHPFPDDPDDPKQWFRALELPTPQEMAGLSYQEAVELAEYHLAIIAGLGSIALPAHEQVIVSQRALKKESVIVYQATNHVEGVPVNFLHPDLETARAIVGIYATLSAYFDFVRKTGQPAFLSDIRPLRQYMIGMQEGDTSSQVYLVDVGPEIEPTNSVAFDNQERTVNEWHLAYANALAQYEANGSIPPDRPFGNIIQ